MSFREMVNNLQLRVNGKLTTREYLERDPTIKDVDEELRRIDSDPIPGWDTVICPACGAEWKDEKPPCAHLDLEQEWPDE